MQIDRWHTPIMRYLLHYFVFGNVNSSAYDVKRNSSGSTVYTKRRGEAIESYAIFNRYQLIHVIENIDRAHKGSFDALARRWGRKYEFIDAGKGPRLRLVVFHDWPGGGVRSAMNKFVDNARFETRAALQLTADLLDREWRDDLRRMGQRRQ